MLLKCRAQLTEAPEIEQFEKHFLPLDTVIQIIITTHPYSVSFIKSHQITDSSPVLKPSLLIEMLSTVENIRYNLLTHAMDAVNLDSDLWLNFANLM